MKTKSNSNMENYLGPHHLAGLKLGTSSEIQNILFSRRYGDLIEIMIL